MNIHINRDTGTKYSVKNFEELVFIDAQTPRETAIVGGFGVGKTTLGIIKVLEKLYLGCTGSIVVRANPNLKVLFSEFKKWVDPNLVVSKQRYRLNSDWNLTNPCTFEFKTGATLFLQYGGYEHLHAPSNLNFSFLDEPISSSELKVMRSHCRRLGPNRELPQLWYAISQTTSLEYEVFNDVQTLNLI